MSHHHKLSFWSAMLVNLNVMFGAGIFVNTLSLAQVAGALGFLSYSIVGILLLPLIIAMARLMHHFPDGGFYVYATKTLHPFYGFLSAWAYFTGKLASATLLIHIFSTLFLSLMPEISLNAFVLDVIIISLFTLLNAWHMKTGKKIMYAFLFFKITPILFAIGCCLYLYKFWSLPAYTLQWSGIPTTLPLVLFAFSGFEACCSLSGSLENARVNGPRVLFLSYAFVVIITVLYQLLFFLTAGETLQEQVNFLGIFPALLSHALPEHAQYGPLLSSLLSLAVACASLGGSYGILFSNHWNLYALAKHRHLFFSRAFATLNAHAIPMLCVVAEAFFCFLYLSISQGTVVILQQISVLGCSVAYLLSIIGLLVYNRGNTYAIIQPWLCNSAIISCLMFIGLCIRNFSVNGIGAFAVFSGIICCGLIMYYLTSHRLLSENNK